MSFFQKVMSTMSSLTAVTIKGYEIDKDAICTGGVQGQWKIHNAQKADKSKQLASAFVIQKKQLKETDKEETIAIYKREATQIARLRHPAILSLQEALHEDATQLVFFTERVECSLAAALQKPELFQEHCSSDIELQMHLLELVESLLFLHNDARMAHLDLNPNSIFITSSGAWKIGNLAFSQQIVNKNELIEGQYIDFNSKCKPNPQLNFTAPELLQSTGKCNYNSDIFSFGMVVLRLLKQRNDKISFPEFHQVQDYLNYLQRLPKEVNTYNKYYPQQLVQFLSGMLSSNPNSRPSIQEFQQIDWFKDPLLQAFNILNKITSLEQAQQISFLKGLQQIIFCFDPALLRKRIIPTMLELTRYDYISPQVLKILIEAMKKDDIFDQQAFLQNIWPKIRQVTLGKEIPAQALYDLVSNLQLFHKYITIEELQSSLVPLMIKCYECKIPKLQDIAVRVTPYIVTNSDYTFTKTKILPRILNLCCDSNAEVRKISLICLYKVIDVVDRNYLCDQVLAVLDKVKQIGTDRSINQIILKIYQQISKTLSIEMIGNKILPSITPFLMETQLTRSEFDDYMTTLRSLLDRIQEERYKTLDNTIQQGILPQDMNLDIAEVKKLSTMNNNEQFDFLSQFNQQQSQQLNMVEQTTQPQQIPIQAAHQAQQPDQFQFNQQITQIQQPDFQFKPQNTQAQQLDNFQFKPQNTQALQPDLSKQQNVHIQQSEQYQFNAQGTQAFQPQNTTAWPNQFSPPTQIPQTVQTNFNQSGQYNTNLMNNQNQDNSYQPNSTQAQKTIQISSSDAFGFSNNQTATQSATNNDPWASFNTDQTKKLSQRPLFKQKQSSQDNSQSPQIQQQPQIVYPQVQQPQKLNAVNLAYDPFADLGQPSAQEVWKQPSVSKQPPQSQEKRTYEAFDLI